MKKLLTVLVVITISCLLAVPAFAADKLIVKDSNNPANSVFVVQDTGITNISSPIAGNLLVMATTNPVGGAGFQFNVPSGGSWNFKATGDNGFKIRDAANSKDVLYVQVATGHVGIGTISPSRLLTVGTNGAGSDGSTWFTSSSREYKDNIQELSADKAIETIKNMTPVTFVYKNIPGYNHVGFIAEDVPDLVATPDRKTLSTMDIVAVLTKVVQEQRETLDTKSRIIEKQETTLEQQQKEISVLSERLERLEREVHLKGTFASKSN